MKRHAAFAAERGDLMHWLEHAGFVVGRHDGNEGRFRGQGLGDLPCIDAPVRIDW